jgi:hypothetical protein
MLRTIQWLDKLSAMKCDFVARGMLPGGHAVRPNISQLIAPSRSSDSEEDGDDDDDRPVDDTGVLGSVVLARSRGT